MHAIQVVYTDRGGGGGTVLLCSLLLKIKSNLVHGFDRGKPAAFNVTVAAVLSSILCKEAQCAFSILGRHCMHGRFFVEL